MELNGVNFWMLYFLKYSRLKSCCLTFFSKSELFLGFRWYYQKSATLTLKFCQGREVRRGGFFVKSGKVFSRMILDRILRRKKFGLINVLRVSGGKCLGRARVLAILSHSTKKYMWVTFQDFQVGNVCAVQEWHFVEEGNYGGEDFPSKSGGTFSTIQKN